MAPGQFQPAPPTYDVTVRVKQRKDKFVVCGVPPEEITISKDSRDIEKVRYIGHDVERTKSDLLSMGYDEEKVESMYEDKRANSSSEASVRGDYDGVNSYDDHPADKSQRKVTLTEAYMLVDFDKDGIAEYRRIVKAGMVVFENEIVEDHPFALFTPILMPYKLVGMSFYDLVEDLQRIMTAINRQMLDNFYLSNTPRTEIVEGQVNLDDFLNPVPGGAIRVKQSGMMREVTVPSIAAQAMQGIEYFKNVRDGRTGVKEFSQGLVGNELSKSNIGSEGVSQLMDQAATRQKLLARVFAETGIKRLYRLILKMVTQYQDREEQVKVNGQWLAVDPREWANNYDMVVSVGIGTQSKQVQVAQAMQLLQIQQQAGQYGLTVPQNAYNTLEDLTAALGKTDVSRYFTAPDPSQPPPQAPDPNAHKMAAIQANAQIKQAELQQQGQLQAQKQQGDVEVERMKQAYQAQQSQQETQLEAQRNQLQSESDMTLAREKASLEYQLAMAKAQLAHQTAIEVARINAEAKILAAKAMGAKDASTASADADYQEAHENDA
ncbi:MAG TPA: hypothetical protein VM621_10575 [Luteibacter sp.]|nr:hypothetical protein [Luteibacter sp.]HVI55481.1 hypothetical protein [Luteibacter sp.]